jgi:hypothetical protein
MFALEKVGLRRCVRHAVVHLKNSNTTTDGGDPERPYLDIDAAEEGAGPGPWSSGPVEKVVGRVDEIESDRFIGKIQRENLCHTTTFGAYFDRVTRAFFRFSKRLLWALFWRQIDSGEAFFDKTRLVVVDFPKTEKF